MKTPVYRYLVEITGTMPAEARTLYRSSAYNAAEKGLEHRAEPGATARVTAIADGRVLREFGTNEWGVVYEV